MHYSLSRLEMNNKVSTYNKEGRQVLLFLSFFIYKFQINYSVSVTLVATRPKRNHNVLGLLFSSFNCLWGENTTQTHEKINAIKLTLWTTFQEQVPRLDCLVW